VLNFVRAGIYTPPKNISPKVTVGELVFIPNKGLSLDSENKLCLHSTMTKPGGFWDKANRKLVGDEKMDRLNAEAAARQEKTDARMEKFSAKWEARIIGNNEKAAKLVAENKKMKENKKEIEEGIYPGISGSDLFNATMIAAANRKYSIESSDKAGLTVTFQTHKNETYWDGKLSCFILEVGGLARVTVSGSENRGSTESGFGPGSTFSDGMKGLASKGAFVGELGKFKKEIWRQVENYPKSDATVSHSGTVTNSLPDQLNQLKQLFESGALTEDEYEKAKAKLLR
jgi:hypothetical protein